MSKLSNERVSEHLRMLVAMTGLEGSVVTDEGTGRPVIQVYSANMDGVMAELMRAVERGRSFGGEREQLARQLHLHLRGPGRQMYQPR